MPTVGVPRERQLRDEPGEEAAGRDHAEPRGGQVVLVLQLREQREDPAVADRLERGGHVEQLGDAAVLRARDVHHPGIIPRSRGYGAPVRFGVTMFMTDLTMGPSDLARAAEERGFYSLYLPEHTHVPVSRKTAPPTGGAELADEYRRTLDPLVALATAAASTETIRLGTGVCLVAQREPIVTAKAVATLDLLSRGRFVFGIGFGWNEDEIAHHGVTMPERRDVARE